MATRKRTTPKPRKPAAPAPHAMDDSRRGTPVERIGIVDSERTPIGRFWFLPYYDPKNTVTEAQRQAFKVMMRHPTIKAALLKKTLAVASQPWQLQLANKESPKEQELADFLRHMIDRLPEGMPGLMQTTTLPRLVDGYQAAEKVRAPEWDEPRWRGKIVYDDIRQKPTEMYEPDVDAFARVVGIKGRGPNEGEWWPMSDFFWTRHVPIYDNPLGTSDLAAAYSAWWMQDTVTKLRAIHAEKFTSPMMLAECNDKDGSVVDAALERARSKSWLRVPLGVKVTALEFAQKASADVFKEFLDDCDRKMMLGINGAYLQSLEGQVADGRGSASVSMTVTELFEWWLGAVFCHAIKKQVFREMRDKNFPGVPVPSLTLGGVSEDEITKILANFKSAQDLGFELSRSEVAERTSLQQAKDDADKLTPRPTTVPGWSPPAPFKEPEAKPVPASLPKEPKPLAFADVPRDEVALAGPDGRQAAKLLGKAKDDGARTLYYLARRAVARLLDQSNPQAASYLFDDAELIRLTDSLAATNATANLLGRARVRERAEQANFREQGVMKYSDDDCFAMFADAPPQVLPPQQAVGYFQGLVPSLAVRPETFGPMLRREAFTLAASTDEVMLGRVKSVISEALQTGNTSGRAAQIDAILSRAGVSPANPQYAEAVFRTNMMDSFNQGAMQELQSPEMQEFFPAFEYLAIPDSRARPEHAARHTKLYPNSTTFAEVRGGEAGDVINCRCSFRPIDKYEFDEMLKSGKKIETSW